MCVVASRLNGSALDYENVACGNELTIVPMVNRGVPYGCRWIFEDLVAQAGDTGDLRSFVVHACSRKEGRGVLECSSLPLVAMRTIAPDAVG